MANPNRPARLNRTLLLIVALVLLVVAAFALLTGAGVLPLLDAGATLTPATLAPPTWAAYLTLLVALVVGLLAVRWLLAQAGRRAKTQTWRLGSDPAAGATHLDARTAVEPLVDEIEAYPGVHRASARLAGGAARPTLYLSIGTEDAADISELRRRIDAEAIDRLRHALDLDELPAELLIRLDDARSARLG